MTIVYKTEPEIGLAIKESGIEREKLYVVTKVMGGIADIENALKTSLKKLQLDHVDLYNPQLRPQKRASPLTPTPGI